MVDQVNQGLTLRGRGVYEPTPVIDAQAQAFPEATVNPATGLPHFEAPTYEPRGTGTPALEQPVIAPEEPPVGNMESAFAGAFTGGVEYWRAGRERMLFDPDPYYTVDEDLDKFIKEHNLRPNEQEEFKRVKSKEQFDYVKETILDRRERADTAGANPHFGIAGSMLDIDIPVGLVTGGVGYVYKGTRLAKKAVSATAATATMGGIVAFTNPNTTRTVGDQFLDVLFSGLTGYSLHSPKDVVRSTASIANPNLDVAIDEELSTLRTQSTGTTGQTQAVPANVVRVPDADNVQAVKTPFADYQTRVVEDTRKGVQRIRITEGTTDSRFQIKYSISSGVMSVESVQVAKEIQDMPVRLDAYRHGISIAQERGVQFQINPLETTVINTLRNEGYEITNGVVAGAKVFTPATGKISVATEAPELARNTPQDLKRIADEVTNDVLKADVDNPDLEVELTADGAIPKGTRIPLSQPQYDKDGNVLMPKGSSERLLQAQIQSVYDEALYYTKDVNHPFMKLLASAAYDGGDNVPALARVLESRGEVKLAEVEDAMHLATRKLEGTNPVLGRLGAKSHSEAFRKTSLAVFEQMQRIDQFVTTQAVAGIKVTDADILKRIDSLTTPEPIKEVMRTYVRTGFAELRYDDLVRSGLLDADAAAAVARRSTYMPVQHSYARTRLLINEAPEGIMRDLREQEVARFLGRQIQDMYKDLLRPIKTSKGVIRLDAEDLGRQFLKNAKERESLPNTVRTVGVPTGDIVDTLVTRGLDKEEAIRLSEELVTARSKQRGLTNVRRRIDWDWFAKAEFSDGTRFGMIDLINDNPMSVLNEYNRRISKNVALREYGFDDAMLDTMAMEILDGLPKGVDRAKAAKFLGNVISVSKGNPVGEAISPIYHSAQAIAGALVLWASGFYQAVEAATQTQKLGFLRTFPHMVTAMKPMFKGMKGYRSTDLQSAEDAIIGQMMSPDRWRNIYTQFSDDFDVTNSFHEGVQYFGQSTKFLNASEYIKRWQIGAYAKVVTDAFRGAAAGRKGDIKFLKKKLHMSDELVDSIIEQTKLHGDNINAWDADARLAMEQKVIAEGDNLALHGLHGETPSFLDYSAVGKIVFPFMRFVWLAHNKLLRGTYVRDGALATAMVLAVQFPLAVMVAQLKRVSQGEEPFDLDNDQDVKDLISSSMTAMSALGLFSVPVDIILSEGRHLGSTAVFTPVTKTMGLASDVFSEDGASFRDIKEQTPLNTPLALTLLMTAFPEED